MYKLNFQYHFDSAHKLNNYNGKCANLHGHRWNVEVEIEKEYLSDDMVIDFTFLKGIIDELDHKCLNDIIEFNPTAENITRYLQERISLCSGGKVIVKVFESPNASITYYDTSRN